MANPPFKGSPDYEASLVRDGGCNVGRSMAAQTQNLMRVARSMGYGSDDGTAITRVYEKLLIDLLPRPVHTKDIARILEESLTDW